MLSSSDQSSLRLIRCWADIAARLARSEPSPNPAVVNLLDNIRAEAAGLVPDATILSSNMPALIAARSGEA